MSQLSTNTLLVKLDWTKSCAVWLPWHLELEVHTTQCSRHLTVLVDLRSPSHQLVILQTKRCLLIVSWFARLLRM